jgi:hypothetical protein
MQNRGQKLGQSGAVYVEFLCVFGPMILLWLGIGQIGLMYAAHIMVSHAASKAVRAAVVILPDDSQGWEDRYKGVEPFKIGSGGDGLEAYENARSGGRLDGIRRAARLALAPVSPGLDSDLGGALADILVGYLWTDLAVAVTFPNGVDYKTSFDATGPVTARVTFLYKCPVPVVNKLICHNYWGSGSFISEETRQKLEELGELANIDASLDPGLDPRAQKELDTVNAEILGAAGLGLQIAQAGFEVGGGGWKFVAITAERTLPMQGRYK